MVNKYVQPKNLEEIEWKALDSHVLAVAIRFANSRLWTAYIGAVEGKNHNIEWEGVHERGNKLPQKVAELLFPEYKGFIWSD